MTPRFDVQAARRFVETIGLRHQNEQHEQRWNPCGNTDCVLAAELTKACDALDAAYAREARLRKLVSEFVSYHDRGEFSGRYVIRGECRCGFCIEGRALLAEPEG